MATLKILPATVEARTHRVVVAVVVVEAINVATRWPLLMLRRLPS